MGKLMKEQMNAINATLAQTITDIQALRPTVEDLRYELTHLFGATDVASGSVASFSDGAGGVAVKDLKVIITSSTSQVVITNQGSGRTESITVDLPISVSSGTLDVTKGTLVSGGQTYQLTPKDLYQFTLDNNISANCGSVEVTYRLNLNTAIERLQGV